jgi:simple sugar transport system ATP-binding protein
MLGREETSGSFGRLSRAAAAAKVRELSDRYGLDVDPDALVQDLPVGVQQRVEIIKALMSDARVLILDEPTAVLTPHEIDDLTRVVRTLREQGTSVVFINHKLREVRAVADRITVIRRGKVIGEARVTASEQEVAAMMVGRDVQLTVTKPQAEPGEVALRIAGLSVRDDRGRVSVDGVDLEVRAGEIVALAGVQGNGQEELVEAVLGLRTPTAGSILLGGAELVGRTPHEVLAAGVGFVPEDRQHDGLVGSFTIAENLVLDLTDSAQYARGARLKLRAVRANAEARIAEYDIRPADATALAGTLSGGNQQKVVLAREMSRPLRLLVISQPTRGVDVGAQEFIHRRIVTERERGTPVVIVSTELDEIRALADRIAVMYRGRIIAEFPAGASSHEIGLMMAGASSDQEDHR